MCQTFALPIIVHVIFVQWEQLTCAIGSYPIAISYYFRLIYFSTGAIYIAHARFCFLATFRELSLKLYFMFTSHSYILCLHHILYNFILQILLALSPTCTANWCYTHISMLHRESSYLALPTVAIVCHNNSILAYSPLERLLPRPPDRNFDTHNNQYNDLNLVIFTSTPNLTN